MENNNNNENEEIKAMMDEFGKSLKFVGELVKSATDTAIVAGLEAKDVIEKKLEEVSGDLENIKKEAKSAQDRADSKIASELLKAQMMFNQAKENMIQRAEAKDKERLEKYINDQLEYAQAAITLAAVASDEAKIAFLNASEAKKELIEKYGDKE